MNRLELGERYSRLEGEARVLRGVLETLTRLGIPFRRCHVVAAQGRVTRNRGFPDVIACLKPGGRMLAIETKSKDGKLRPEQEAFRREFEAVGALYVVIRSPSELDEVLKMWGILR